MLLAIEGVDGAGKATLAGALVAELRGRGKVSTLLSFPRYKQSATSEAITSLLANPSAIASMPPRTIAAIFATERFEIREQLAEWASSDAWLIVDRYTFSNVAYQGAKLTSVEAQAQLEHWICGLEFSTYQLPRPDITVFLDVDLTEARRRREQRSTTGGRIREDAYETDYLLLDHARRAYLSMAERNLESRWLTVSSSGNPAATAKAIVDDHIEGPPRRKRG